MNLYGLFILDVNIKYIVFSILYRHINVPMACKEFKLLYVFNCLFVFCATILSTYGKTTVATSTMQLGLTYC